MSPNPEARLRAAVSEFLAAERAWGVPHTVPVENRYQEARRALVAAAVAFVTGTEGRTVPRPPREMPGGEEW